MFTFAAPRSQRTGNVSRYTPETASWKTDVHPARRKLSLMGQPGSAHGSSVGSAGSGGRQSSMDTQEDEISASAALLSLAGVQ